MNLIAAFYKELNSNIIFIDEIKKINGNNDTEIINNLINNADLIDALIKYSSIDDINSRISALVLKKSNSIKKSIQVKPSPSPPPIKELLETKEEGDCNDNINVVENIELEYKEEEKEVPLFDPIVFENATWLSESCFIEKIGIKLRLVTKTFQFVY